MLLLQVPESGKILSGVVVQKGVDMSVMHPDDLVSYTKYRPSPFARSSFAFLS